MCFDHPSSEADGNLGDWLYGKDGSETAAQLEVGGKIQGEYSCIKGKIDLSYATRTEFKNDKAYALLTYADTSLKVSMATHAGTRSLLDTTELADFINKMGLPMWDGGDTDVVAKYSLLFEVVGTHIITQVNYGSRLQLVCYLSADPAASLPITRRYCHGAPT